MDIALLVTAPPASGQTALDFARATLATGHRVPRVFFYRDAVHTALDPELGPAWRALASSHDVDLLICVGAAQRRGLVDARGHSDTLPAAFSVSGLGQLAEVTATADRLVEFNG